MKREEKPETPTKSWILNLLINLADSGAWAILPHTTKAIFITLLIHRIKEKEGFMMSVKRITKETGVSRRAVFYGERQLEAARLISKKRGPKTFHGMNMYHVPLNPVINIMELKAELNLQRKQITRGAKNDTLVNEKSRKEGGVQELHSDLRCNGCTPTRDAMVAPPSKQVKQVNEVKKEEAKKESRKSKPFSEGVNLKAKKPKLDTSEKAFAKGIDLLIAEKTKLKEREDMSKNNTATKRKKRRKRKAKQLQKEVKT